VNRRRLAGILVVAGWGCSPGAAPGPGPASSVPSPAGPPSSAASAWVAVRAPTGVSLLEVPAEVLGSPESTGAVVAPFPARVIRIFVRPGQQITRNQPVAAVVMPQLVEAAGHYAAARTRHGAYRARRAQLDKLKAEGLAKTAELAEVETHVAEALADQQAAMATLRSGGLDPAAASGLIDGGGVSTLRSPVDGIVVEVDAAIGEMREGAGRPIARIVGEGEPRIQARTAHLLPRGARFEFIAAGGARTEVTRLSQSPAIDARDGTRLSWFEAPRGARLPGGLSGRLRVILDSADGVAAVPAGAVALDASKTYVTVRDSNGSRRVEVEVLATSGADALIRGPIVVGQEVAAEGQPSGAAAPGARP
jgi:cobalt-zinc-cadmium efflux system membrane fusion protein